MRFEEVLAGLRDGCLVNSIFMRRGAPGEHESSVATLLFREFRSL
jgi:hypothetical protein